MHHIIKTADPEVQQLLLMCLEPKEIMQRIKKTYIFWK
jgi:hypothetical protein